MFIVLALCLGACKCNEDPEDSVPPEGDTDTDTDADTDTDTDADTDADTDCTAVVVETSPEDDATGWYYRDELEVLFSEASAGLASISLTDEGGDEVGASVSWQSSDFLAVVAADIPLDASSAYLMTVDVCDATTEVAFSTSAYGTALEAEAAALEHNTYVLDLSEVTFTEPENFELLLTMFGVAPLLVGVAQADDATITFFVAEGKKRSDGTYKMLDDGRFWWFDPADFTTAPYFSSQLDELSLEYEGAELPIKGFSLEGTFASDGSSIGGMTVAGVADTRYLSEAFGDDELYYCDFMEDWGIHCIACDDGVETCIEILAEDGEAPIEPDLDIIPTD